MKLIVATPFVAGLACRNAADVSSMASVTDSVFSDYTPQFFTESEIRTIRVLADMVIPADERSGSASDAFVPEFIDFTVNDRPSLQTPVRGGLHWLDATCHRRFGAVFSECSEADRVAMLEDIAWPEAAPEEYRPGVTFFNTFRDIVASGFWSSRMGIEDLAYMGNGAHASWDGCPTEVLERLGVSYG